MNNAIEILQMVNEKISFLHIAGIAFSEVGQGVELNKQNFQGLCRILEEIMGDVFEAEAILEHINN